MSLLGFLCVNKPRKMTSRDAVNIAQGVARAELGGGRGNRVVSKAGHAGTLDPLADGVLVIGIGPAVRLVPYVQAHSKTYVGTFKLGAESASGDLEEPVTERPDGHVPTADELNAVLTSFVGQIRQRPPSFSAIKVNGRRLYLDARAGRDVEVPERTVVIHAIKVLDYGYPELKLEITCGSGTYIRTLGIDIAAAVGTFAVMTALTRTAIGPFIIDQSIGIERLRKGGLDQLLIPALRGVDHMPVISCDQEQSRRLGDGLCIETTPQIEFEVQEAAAVAPDGQLRAIVKRKLDQWCPYRVFPASS